MNRESGSLHTFCPEAISAALEMDLIGGLRALADAVESGAVDGRLLNVQGCGFVSWRDDRAHIIVTVDVAAQVFEWKAGEKIPLVERAAPESAWLEE